MAKTPTQLGATAEYRPYAQAVGNKGLNDYVGTYDGFLGSTKSAFLTGRWLRLPGTVGNYASAPDSAALSITGDIDIRVRVGLDDWTPGVAQMLVGKGTDTGPSYSYFFVVNTDGKIRFSWSTDGTLGNLFSLISSEAPAFTDRATYWVRVAFDADNGAAGRTATFYTSADDSNDPDAVTWVQLGTAQTSATATSIFNNATSVNVGAYDNGTVNVASGAFRRVQIRNGIGGTVAFDPDFTAQAGGAPSFTESSSNAATVTINSSAADTNDPVYDGNELDFSTDDYVQVPDAAALNFGAAFSVMFVVKAAAAVDKAIGGQWDTNAQRSWLIRTDATTGGKPRILLSADGGSTNVKDYTSSLTAYDGTYHTVAFTFPGGTPTVYVDGTADAAPTKTTDATVASLFNSTAAATLGAQLATGTAGSFLTGSFAAVALFPTALSASDVAHLHQHYKTTLAAESITLPAGPAVGTGGIEPLFSGFQFGYRF